MAKLLARSAEDLFWLARYVERIENIVRLLDITETFARDRHGRNWLSVVQINADEKAFFAKHSVADAKSVADFYMLDADNPTSIQSSILAAHRNARSLRPVISIEMWAQINVMRHHLRQLTYGDIAPALFSKMCRRIREECQIHAGIAEGSLSQDEAWHFYQLGKQIERADQTTRLLDIKFHMLARHAESEGSAIDVSQWNVLLRTAAGYQAFRRQYQGRMTPEAIAGFLIFSDTFPRAVLLCVKQIESLLTGLRSRYNLTGGSSALERIDDVRAVLGQVSVETVIARGMHDFLDWLQVKLAETTSGIAEGFFGMESLAA
jgi:uncharacterized alpha-E superfamily protein